jgi:hypothetical protein
MFNVLVVLHCILHAKQEEEQVDSAETCRKGIEHRRIARRRHVEAMSRHGNDFAVMSLVLPVSARNDVQYEINSVASQGMVLTVHMQVVFERRCWTIKSRPESICRRLRRTAVRSRGLSCHPCRLRDVFISRLSDI